jgi:hypothetical protein
MEIREIDKKTELREFHKRLWLLEEKHQWQIHEKETLLNIKKQAALKLAKIEAKQAKEYQELFPPTRSKIESEPIMNGSQN